jgi:hypothetical protein
VIEFNDLAKNPLNQTAIIDPTAPEIDPKTGKPIDAQQTLVPVKGSNPDEPAKQNLPPQPQLAQPIVGN